MKNIMLFETFGGYDYSSYEEYGRYVYSFTCKDGTVIHIQFTEDTDNEGDYYRDYGTGELDCLQYSEINTNDSVRILRTVTRATVDFLNKIKPKRLIILHVLTSEEIEDKHNRFANGEPANDKPNKRARVNKMFLEADLPKNYSYTLKKNMSYIVKID